MKSLADSLGLTPVPDTAEPTAKDAKPKSAKQLATSILNSKEYLESVQRRIAADILPPAVEVRLMEYAYGKPVDRVEVRDKTNPLEGLTMEQLETRLLGLRAVVAKLKAQRDETASSGSVH